MPKKSFCCLPRGFGNKTKFSCCCCVLSLIFIVIFCCMVFNSIKSSGKCNKTEIDCVYTWVNGSDDRFLLDIQRYSKLHDRARYDDKDELRYSLRSLEKYAPWIRNVYILTNGQIPHWLNLENPRICIVTHQDLADEATMLPTYSSNSIETLLHRIPNLSKNFIYLNDDIYLGDHIYPDDFYTESEGVNVFSAWQVPDCGIDCPWIFIGDGSCDQHCYMEECQFDGGDCDNDQQDTSQEYDMHTPPVEETFIDIPKIENIKKRVGVREVYEMFKKYNATARDFVERFNQEKIKLTKYRQSKGGGPVARNNEKDLDDSSSRQGMNSQDIFAQSLIYTNKLFNLKYGFKNRKVLGHVAFYLNKDIIKQMMIKFEDEFAITKMHKFRQNNDLQFAFTYYNFLMSETRNKSLSEIFDQFDTDMSGTWSDREIRTLLTKIYPLPLDWNAVRFFEEVITNCSLQQQNNFLPPEHEEHHPTMLYERYVDSTIPTVTKKLVLNCIMLTEMMKSNFASQPKYKFHVNQKTGIVSNFKMLTSNISSLVDSLDELRKNPKKFNCINDNLDETMIEENQLIKSLLEDFYLSLFPAKSHFELSYNYRNRFQYYDEYKIWLKRKNYIQNFVYAVCILIFLVCAKILCFKYKGKIVRKLIVMNRNSYNAI